MFFYWCEISHEEQAIGNIKSSWFKYPGWSESRSKVTQGSKPTLSGSVCCTSSCPLLCSAAEAPILGLSQLPQPKLSSLGVVGWRVPWALSGLESYLLLYYCLLRGDFSGLLFSLPREEAQPHPCFTSAAKSLWGDVLRIHGKIQENGI